MKADRSIYIRKGFASYTDFSKGNEHGNPIDFLVRHLGYSFVDAVLSLTEGMAVAEPAEMPAALPPAGRSIRLPERAAPPYQRVYAYLLGRGIPSSVIRFLFQRGLLYQERDHGNAVFINPERDYCEIRGTYTYAQKPFHGCRKTKPDRFWYILSHGKKPVTAYLCESAIDAISLFILHHREGLQDPAVYISIGGVSNQRTIDRVKKRMPAVLSVDNDNAGKLCRERNPDIPSLVPARKDWNEDLQAIKHP